MEKKFGLRSMTVCAVMGAVSFLLMFFDFSVPLMPPFIKMDLSDMPALVTAFSIGPAGGATVCLIKNLLHLMRTSTGGVGELANLILSVAFVVPAGIIYARSKTRATALVSALAGAAISALVSLPANYFITYPFYMNFMPLEAILDAYRLINPNIRSLPEALLKFNVPFTFVKCLFSVAITFLIYKKLSPVLHGTDR